jgi:hypothetical protein
MRRRFFIPGVSGLVDFLVRIALSALIFNIVSIFLKQMFDEDERVETDTQTMDEKIIDVKAEQVLDA